MNFFLMSSINKSGIIKALLLGLLVLSFFIPRALSVAYNLPYWHDNDLYGNAAESLAKRGDMMIGVTKWTNDELSYSVKKLGGEYLSHNPAWALLGAGVAIIVKLSGFDALAVLSLIFGLLLILLIYILGNKLVGYKMGILVASLSGFSYLLIDYSGNGSYYILQAVLYLLFILALWTGGRWSHPSILGVIAGLAILTVHQSVALIPAYFVHLFLTVDKMRAVKSIVIFVSIIMLMYLPWGLRNKYLLKDFFPPTDTNYVWMKLGIEKTLYDDITVYSITKSSYVLLVKRVIFTWLPNNLYFINRQLFLLVPIVYIFSLFASLNVIFGSRWSAINRETLNRLLPLLILLIGHIFISAVWPVTKFRYFISMVPLVQLLGCWFIDNYTNKFKIILYTLSLVSAVVLSTLTYLGSSTHTYFYGGILTTDPFGKKWEIDYTRYYQHAPRDSKL